ncbi:hypothetical protein pdam_00006345 [Pocillopora damicornis]|uniref:Uncharacterized protein n=1 Tax=Pocillopora damicornis TaxID=46731 RepID=A0A3M6TR17_POCDA|nr:hypothetical protein pdam_00006345 [Pocillopora damicornis]
MDVKYCHIDDEDGEKLDCFGYCSNIFKTSYGAWFVEEIQTIIVDKERSHSNSTCTVEFDEADNCNHYDETERLLGVAGSGGLISQRKYFCHKYLRYVWNEDQGRFHFLRGLDSGSHPGLFYQCPSGLSLDEVQIRQKMYGPNVIDVTVKSYWRLFLEEDYYYYALAILIVTVVSITITVYQTKVHLERLRSMVAVSERVTVLRNNADQIDVSSDELVPGDLLVIPPNGAQVHCDSVLISGNCIVNESMLTGESVPVTKIPLPYIKRLSNSPLEQREDQYSPERHKRHTLFNGTNVIQTRYYGNVRVLAVVVRTGFSTTKGGLMRSILSPKPVGFKFFRDSMRFIGLMTILAMVGFSYSVYISVVNGMSVGKILVRSLDIITIAVPPALPAAMSVGIVYALQRLKKKQIYCINPSRISVCGKLKLICFDKIWHSGIKCRKYFSKTYILEEPGEDNTKFDNIVPTIVKPKTAEEFIIESALKGHTPYEIAVLRQFPFSSELQRMSVVCRTLGAPNMDVYVKGAPETITSLCQPQTGDFTNVLQHYTTKGYRVLGLAWKPLDSKLSWHHVHRVSRDRIESNLQFLGLLILQNAVKPQSYPVIRTLQNADIRTVMVTGDNMLTAVSVARDCGMIAPTHQVVELTAKLSEDHSHEIHVNWCVVGAVQSRSHDYKTERNYIDGGRRCIHVAVSGKTFALIRIHKPQLFNKLLMSGTVFARMSPDQKTHLIQGLQNLNYCVGMCGDGANDCGIPHIECVPAVIREGRAALVTSFGIFKYMALYSIVQFVSVLLLYSISSNLGDWQYLYIDLVIITSLALVMGKTEAYPMLVAKRPGGSLMSPIVLFSLISHIAVQTVVQVAGFYYVRFSAVHVTEKNATYVKCHQNAVLFALSSFQYIHLAVVFSGGAPYRKPFYKSGYFLLVVVFLTLFTGFLVVLPGETLQLFFELATIPDKIFKWTLLGIAACNCLISLFIEMFIVPSQWLKKVLNRLFCKTRPKNYFRILQHQLEHDFDWPPSES